MYTAIVIVVRQCNSNDGAYLHPHMGAQTSLVYLQNVLLSKETLDSWHIFCFQLPFVQLPVVQLPVVIAWAFKSLSFFTSKIMALDSLCYLD